MAALGNVSVTSAAIIEGSLIIGLSDGSVINCGYVQGPQGLTGAPGPVGAQGERGTDGATIHTTKGPPPADLGKDGDYCINNRDWFIFGPKASGMWGAGQGMLPRDINQPVFGGSAGQGGGGSRNGDMGPAPDPGTVFTNAVLLSGTGRAITAPGGNIIPEGLNLSTQSNLNKWIEDSLRVLDSALPIAVVDDLPDSGGYQGDMVLKGTSLYVWNGSEWVEIAGGSGGGVTGKENKPWLQINSWKVEFKDRTAWGEAWMYQAFWEVNPNCTWTWQYEVDINGDGDWIDVADHPQKDALGYFPDGENQASLLLKKQNQAIEFPNALIRFRLTGELNGILSELSTGVVLPWEDRSDVYDPPLYEDGTAVDLDPYATTDYVDEKVSGTTEYVDEKVSGLPYRLGTDKAARSARYGEPAIELVDAEDNFSNVKFFGLNGIKVESTIQGINIDGSDLVVGDGVYLPLSGGTLTGEFAIDQPSGTALRIRKSGVDKVKIEHGGKIFCGYDLSLDTDDRTVTTKGWVKEQIAAIPAPEAGGGVGFTEKYNGNKLYKAGLDTTALSEGEVMFLQNGVTTTMLAAVTHVALPEAGIDWTKFTKIGTIEVHNGGTLCGHLQVISAQNNPGRNWLIKVKALDIVSNDIEPEAGHPCYFWGMFTE